MYSKIVFFILFFSLVHTLSAQEVMHHINEVTIEAQAKDKAIDQQKKAGQSSIVISSKDINAFGHQTAGDVLKFMPRIILQGPPTFSRNIMMAGLDKQFQTVLIDGNRPAGGEDYRDFKLDRIPTDMIEEIEIIYNPSVDLGADASVGVVNIKLKDTPNKELFSANVALSHTSTHGGISPDFNATYGNKLGKLSFIGSYSYNQFNRTNVNTIGDGVTSGTEREDLLVKIHGLTGAVKYKFNERNSLNYKVFYSHYAETSGFLADIKRRSEGGVNPTADTATDDKLRSLQTHTLEYLTKGELWKWTNTISFSQHIDTKDRWRYQSKTTGLETSFEDEGQTNSEGVYTTDYSYRLNNHLFKTGARLSGLNRDYDRLVYSKPASNKFWSGIEDGSYQLSEYRAGTYVSDEVSIRKWWFSPAARLDYDKRAYQTVVEEGEYNYTSLNASLHGKYTVQHNLFLKGDVAHQIARPPFNQQVPIDKIKFKKSTVERGNKELQPSTALNMSLGLEKYFANNSYFTVRGFYNVLRHVIENKEVGIDSNNGFRIIQAVNVDSGFVYGIDFDTHIKLINTEANVLSFSGNLSWLGSQVRDATTGNLRRLNEQPQWITNGSLDYINLALKFQVSVGVNYVGERYIAGGTDEGTINNTLVYEPYMQWDGRVKYFFKPWGSVYVNATNIFNQQYQITQGAVHESEVVGMDARVGISLTF